ncbi:unnamed protein product, partial [Amoebophrya sp. A120]|eukprot:GSA120T00003989001.1
MGERYVLFVYVESLSGIATPVAGLMGPAIMFRPTFSNSFKTKPYLPPNLQTTANSIFVTFQASEPTGRAWITVVDPLLGPGGSNHTLDDLLQATPHSCLISNLAIDDSLQTVELKDCQLLAGQSYEVKVYIQDSMKGVFDGIMSESLEVNVPYSNRVQNIFLQYPLPATTPNADGLSLTFVPSSRAGVAIVNIQPKENARTATVETVRAFAGALGDPVTCRKTNEPLLQAGVTLNDTTTPVLFSLSNCQLESYQEYAAMVMYGCVRFEIGAVLSSPLYFKVNPSNVFIGAPVMSSTPTRDTVKVTFESQNAGATFIYVVQQAVAISIADSKALIAAQGPPSCQLQEVAIVKGGNTFEMTSCTLASGSKYKVVVYIETSYATTLQTINGVQRSANDGTLTFVNFELDFAASNTFLLYPKLTSVPTYRGVEFQFSAEFTGYYWAHFSKTLSCSQPSGRAWVNVVLNDKIPYINVNTMKGLPNTFAGAELTMAAMQVGNPTQCSWSGRAIDDSVQNVRLEGCNFAENGIYAIFIYIEDLDGRGDGSFFGPMVQRAPRFPVVSNEFQVWPHLLTESTSGPGGQTIRFTPLYDGLYYVLI